MTNTGDVKSIISSGSLVSLEDINTKTKLISVDDDDNFSISATKIGVPSVHATEATIIESADIYCHSLAAKVKMDASALTMSGTSATSGKTLSLDFTKASDLTADKTIYVAPEGGNMLTDSNVKTIFGNSLYGSGDITANFNTTYFSLKNSNSGGGTVTVNSGTNRSGNYTLTLPSKETGIIGIAPYLIMKEGLSGSTQAITVSSGTEQYFSNTRCTLTPGYSYLLVGWVDCTIGDSATIMAANIRVFRKDGTTKRFERGCRTTLHSGGGCMVVAFYRCENDGDFVRLNTYNYRSSSTTFNGSLSVYRFVEED